MISINVLLTTIGREDLKNRMLPSLVNQLLSQDYLTIVSDLNHDFVADCISSFNFICTVIHIRNPNALGYWGHASRSKYQNYLLGDFIINADDDDRFTEDAFDIIRQIVVDMKVAYIFKMQVSETIFWKECGLVQEGNIGTPCGVIPNNHLLPNWEHFYGGDGRFYEKLYKIMDFNFDFVDHVIYKVKDTE